MVAQTRAARQPRARRKAGAMAATATTAPLCVGVLFSQGAAWPPGRARPIARGRGPLRDWRWRGRGEVCRRARAKRFWGWERGGARARALSSWRLCSLLIGAVRAVLLCVCAAVCTEAGVCVCGRSDCRGERERFGSSRGGGGGRRGLSLSPLSLLFTLAPPPLSSPLPLFIHHSSNNHGAACHVPQALELPHRVQRDARREDAWSVPAAGWRARSTIIGRPPPSLARPPLSLPWTFLPPPPQGTVLESADHDAPGVF